MKIIFVVALVVLVLAIVASATVLVDNTATQRAEELELRTQFVAFTRKFERSYVGEEFNKRYNIFKSNLDLVKLVQEADAGATYGVTKFMDLTPEEFRTIYLSKTPITRDMIPTDAHHTAPYPQSVVQAAPDTFDWRDHGAVTPVKNQGQCGSCWAFSTTGNIEGQLFLKHGSLVSLSEQNLVDCDHTCGAWKHGQACDAGCNGGLMWLAMTYVATNGGLDTESSYPYTAMDGSCRYNAANSAVKVSNYTMLSTDEGQMAAWLSQNGPISIAINANWLQYYIGGVSDPVLCDKNTLDHGVLIVGYGTGKTRLGRTIPYWLIKNSWGTSWGEKGYFMIKRGDDKCGLASVPCSAIVV